MPFSCPPIEGLSSRFYFDLSNSDRKKGGEGMNVETSLTPRSTIVGLHKMYKRSIFCFYHQFFFFLTRIVRRGLSFSSAVRIFGGEVARSERVKSFREGGGGSEEPLERRNAKRRLTAFFRRLHPCSLCALVWRRFKRPFGNPSFIVSPTCTATMFLSA